MNRILFIDFSTIDNNRTNSAFNRILRESPAYDLTKRWSPLQRGLATTNFNQDHLKTIDMLVLGDTNDQAAYDINRLIEYMHNLTISNYELESEIIPIEDDNRYEIDFPKRLFDMITLCIKTIPVLGYGVGSIFLANACGTLLLETPYTIQPRSGRINVILDRRYKVMKIHKDRITPFVTPSVEINNMGSKYYTLDPVHDKGDLDIMAHDALTFDVLAIKYFKLHTYAFFFKIENEHTSRTDPPNNPDNFGIDILRTFLSLNQSSYSIDEAKLFKQNTALETMARTNARTNNQARRRNRAQVMARNQAEVPAAEIRNPAGSRDAGIGTSPEPDAGTNNRGPQRGTNNNRPRRATNNNRGDQPGTSRAGTNNNRGDQPGTSRDAQNGTTNRRAHEL